MGIEPCGATANIAPPTGTIAATRSEASRANRYVIMAPFECPVM